MDTNKFDKIVTKVRDGTPIDFEDAVFLVQNNYDFEGIDELLVTTRHLLDLNGDKKKEYVVYKILETDDTFGLFIEKNRTFPEYAIVNKELDFGGVSIEKEIICSYWIFKKISFMGGVFWETVCFERAHFIDKVCCPEAYFAETACFMESVFWKEINFKGSCFNGEVNFRGCYFKEKSNFNDSKYEKKVCFYYSNFEGKLDFSNSYFNGEVNFRGCRFKSNVNFSLSHFMSKSDFEDSQIYNIMYFIDSTFMGGGVLFRNIYCFIDSRFYIDRCVFKEKVDLYSERIYGKIIINKTFFRNEFEFNYDSINEMKGSRELLYFRKKEIRKRLKEISDILKVCNEVIKIGCQYEENELTKEIIDIEKNLAEEKHTKKMRFSPLVIEEEPKTTAETFRILEKYYRAENYLDRELDMHYYYMKYKNEAQLLESKKSGNICKAICGWIKYWGEKIFLDYTSKYFTDYGQVAKVAGITLLFFSVLYSLVCNGVEITHSDGTSTYISELPICERSWKSVYFSLITFTTIGYANIQPSGSLAISIISGFQSLLGVLLVSMFMVTVAKRVLG